MMTRIERVDRLLCAIPSLSDYRLQLIERIVAIFDADRCFTAHPSSKLITASVLEDFGDVLCLHHCFSREPFSKDKFEYALERVLNASGITAKLAARGTRGVDIEIAGEQFSLKTEAAKGIREDTILISKFMELGGGKWGDDPEDLIGLRAQFLANLEGVHRILILRLVKKGEPLFRYELVEIPKALFLRAVTGHLEMRQESKQSPKPGYCHVEENGELLFSLYFDGGGERKLQIKGLRKELCLVHATWEFPRPIEHS